MKKQFINKLYKKEIIPITTNILKDKSMMSLITSMYENPKFICTESLYLDEDLFNIILPNNLTIRGNLIISRCDEVKLPNNLIIENILNIDYKNTIYLKNLKANQILINDSLIEIDSLSVEFRELRSFRISNVLNYDKLHNRFKKRIKPEYPIYD